MSELPKGWEQLELADCVEILDSKRKPVNNRERQSRVEGKLKSELYPYYGATGQVGYIDDYLFDEELVALGEDGVPFFDPLKYKAYIISGKTWVNNHAHVLKGVKVNNRYLCHYLNQADYHGYVNGATRLKLTQANMRKMPIKVAPLAEQKRIADKLDSLLAKVEAAQTRLDRIPSILKRFRQSVLAAATSGELTNDWREENDADLEWKRVQVSEIVEKIEAGKSIKCDERPPQKDEFGIIKISAVTWGVYNELESKTLFDKSVFLENRRINVGDFLISRANTIELLGMPVIVHEVTKNLMLSDKVLRLVMDDIDKSWLSFYFRSPEGRKQIENGSSGNQESMRNIGQKALMAIELKNPTKPEKLEIIRRVDELFSKADSVEQQYNAAKARLDKLTQSILKKAFKGELLSSSIDSEVVKALDGELAMQY